MKFFFLAIMAAYLAGNGYIFAKLMRFVSGLSIVHKIGISILFWTASLSMFISIFTRDADFPVWFSKALFATGSVWMVFTLYMVMALLAADLLRLCIPLLRPALSRYGFLIAFVITGGLLAYGNYNYRNPKINEIDINLCPDSLLQSHAIKIVAISDIHLGNGTGNRMLDKYIELINALKPDLILIAGDLVDNSVTPLYRNDMASQLNRLQAPMGIYMVPGNHEYISGINKVEEFLEQTTIQLLKDSVATLPCGINIIGRDDRSNRSRKSPEELLNTTVSARSAILLDHQPYALAKTDSLGIALQISGHTHHGQIWPLNWLTDRLYEQSHGYRKWNNSHIYVSSGLSLWGPPFRIGTESEIVVINIK